jgi:DNA polymerase-1
VHTHYAQAVAVTGRLSSSEPNLQNIPIKTAEGRRVREAFIAPQGYQMASADYSQIELRIMAHLSEDAQLLAAFAAHEDVHSLTAAEVFGIDPQAVSPEQRRYAKTINFGLIYGMGPFGLAKALHIELSAARSYIDRYFARYPGVARYMEMIRQQAKAQGFVQTCMGRRLFIPGISAPQAAVRAGAERAAINAPMQGTAADLIKLSMVAIDGLLREENRRTRMVMQVHDELVFEVPEEEVTWFQVAIPQAMAQAGRTLSLRVPLVAQVGLGPNWEQAH